MNLSNLSIIHLGALDKQPPTLTNEDRIRAYRAIAKPELGNGYPWVFRSTYAREQFAPDPSEYAEGFAFKHGLTRESL